MADTNRTAVAHHTAGVATRRRALSAATATWYTDTRRCAMPGSAKPTADNLDFATRPKEASH
jgi:hypothetical protein